MKKIITLFALIMCTVFTNTLFAQFTGGTYTIGTAGGENYSSLFSACAALNLAGSLDGDVIFEITTDLTEGENVPLGVNTNLHTLTFRPSADVDRIITFTKNTSNTGPMGSFVIGTTSLADWNNLVQTDNVVIDGYSSTGSTKRLTFKTSAGVNIRNNPISIVGNSNFITIKNCNVEHSLVFGSGTNIFAVGVYTRLDGTGTYTPDNITIDNCNITAVQRSSSAFGIYYSTTGSVGFTSLPSNCVVKNSTLAANYAGCYMEYCSGIDIYNNTFSIDQNVPSTHSYGIYFSNVNHTETGTINIYNNQFAKLATVNTNSSYGSTYISLPSSRQVTVNIYNNMFTGFYSPTLSFAYEGNSLTCISSSGAGNVGVFANIYFNTILMNNINQGPGTVNYVGIAFNGNTNEHIVNNIISISEGDFTCYGLSQANPNLSGQDPTSDYNLIYLQGASAKYGKSNSVPYTALAEWQSGTTLDSNSITKSVTFASATDLHLSAPSLGDVDLIGTPIGGITTDIDGETRDATYPYIGADENLASPLPVELTAFTAERVDGSVKLNWQTATEMNNYGFEIQRTIKNEKLEITNWEQVGFINGAGNSNSQKSYSFIDKPNGGTKFKYRLKQIDNDGKYEYSKEIEVDLGIPQQFLLAQNYPNPFNPITTIKYSVPAVESGHAQSLHLITLKVYDILGNEVATLVNENKSAGNYEVKFDASNLSSGVYFYRIQTSSGFVSMKKLVLLK